MRKLFRRAAHLGAQAGAIALLLGMGTIMHAADSPPTVKQDVKVYSPDRHFYAVSLVKEQRTCVFRAGTPKPLWELPGYAPVLYLSDDGKHLVEGYEGGNRFSPATKDADLFMTFYAGPSRTATLTVGQVFPHWRELPHSTSGLPWGDFWGFEKPSQFVIRLNDGKKIAFDADTGKQIENHETGRR